MKFSSMVLFSALWFTMVYLPICHMAWAGDGSFFGEMGALDFAGGTVVHINSGVAALVVALMIGKRKGYPSKPIPPHSLTITVVGASMLWVGWFGFNAGSALAADEAAGMAMLVTQVASAAAALTWMAVEWVKHGKASVLGIVTGAVAGLVAITPASGSVGPFGAIIIGFATGLICYYAVTKIKARYGYDDALDVFGVHGVGGIVGALLTAIFVSDTFGGSGLAEGMTIFSQFMAQLKSVVFTFVYSGVLSFILLKLVSMLTGGLRVSEEEEYQGLDITLHNEQGYYQEN
jgi:Amt family ammonium transporter